MNSPKTTSDSKTFFANKKGAETPATDTAASSKTPTAEVKTEQAASSGNSVLGKNIKFRGELIGTENLHIEGVIDGVVIMKGHNLSIGEEGVINANVHAQNLTIHGKLTGDVLADELIQIKNTAIVKGNLIAPRIQLDDGGKFRGSMDMVDTEQEKKTGYNDFKPKLVHPHLPAKDGKTKEDDKTNKNDTDKANVKPNFAKK